MFKIRITKLYRKGKMHLGDEKLLKSIFHPLIHTLAIWWNKRKQITCDFLIKRLTIGGVQISTTLTQQ